MNDEITPAPTPTSSKWLGYNQTVCLLIIGASCLVMLFFRADELFGAAGLKAVYKYSGFVVAYVALVAIPMLFALWGTISWWASFGLGILLLLASPLLNPLIIVLGITASVFGIPVYSSEYLVGISAIILLLIQSLSIKRQKLPAIIVKSATIIPLLFSAILVMPTWFEFWNFETTYFGSISLEDHRYFLYIHSGGFEPEILEFYECNSIGLACQQITINAHDYYRDGDIAFVADRAQNEVRDSI